MKEHKTAPKGVVLICLSLSLARSRCSIIKAIFRMGDAAWCRVQRRRESRGGASREAEVERAGRQRWSEQREQRWSEQRGRGGASREEAL